MGHQIEKQIGTGNCRLTRCSCGRSALQIRDKVVLLSSQQVKELAVIFGSLEKDLAVEKTAWVDKLKDLSPEHPWESFIPQP
jgi:hypothetical protein